jgi:hypothetical protein
MDSKQTHSSRNPSDNLNGGIGNNEDDGSRSTEFNANNGRNSERSSDNNQSTDAILNQLISTVSQATFNGNNAQSRDQNNAASEGQDTPQSFIQQLAALSAANNAAAGVGLPGLTNVGLSVSAANAASNDSNYAMQAAAFLLSATANNLIQANAQQQRHEPQPQLQNLLGNQGLAAGNNLMAHLLAANASAAVQAFHQATYIRNTTDNMKPAPSENPLALGHFQGLAPTVASIPSLMRGSLPFNGVVSDAAAAPLSASLPKRQEANRMTNRRPITLDMDYDSHVLNDYQSILRKQIELFETGPEDVRGKAQGRNKPVVLGQVGIRCRHCSTIPKSARPKGSVYYSRSLVGIYQASNYTCRQLSS